MSSGSRVGVSPKNVDLWPLADIPTPSSDVCFWGANRTFCLQRHSGSVGRELPFHVQAVAPCYVFLAAFVPCYVFLANDEASYISGQVLHPNGGNVIGS
jgi:hypothetical protein